MEKCFLWNLLLNDCLPDNIYTECEEGRLEGLAEGRAEGVQLQNKENAKKMKAMGLPIEVICQVAGLTEEEVDSIPTQD